MKNISYKMRYVDKYKDISVVSRGPGNVIVRPYMHLDSCENEAFFISGETKCSLIRESLSPSFQVLINPVESRTDSMLRQMSGISRYAPINFETLLLYLDTKSCKFTEKEVNETKKFISNWFESKQ